MNNAQLTKDVLAEDQPADIAPMLRSRQEKIVKIIEAIDSIAQSNYWKFLETEVFQGVLKSSVNQLCVEKDEKKMFYLQGKIEILKGYADFKKFSETHRMELKNIKQQLKGR